MATYKVPVLSPGGVLDGGVVDLDTIADGDTKLLLTTTERTKLAGVAAGATANATDTALRARSTHTGTQSVDTITGLGTAATLDVGVAGGVAAYDDNPATASSVVILTSTPMEGPGQTFTSAPMSGFLISDPTQRAAEITVYTVADTPHTVTLEWSPDTVTWTVTSVYTAVLSGSQYVSESAPPVTSRWLRVRVYSDTAQTLLNVEAVFV